MDAKWTRLQTLFHAAMSVGPGERSALLDDRCSGDEELRRQVDSLVRSADDPLSFAGEVQGLAFQLLHEEPLRSGDRLGMYEIKELIGQGGMGVVYRAVRADDAFQLEAAVKVMRPSSVSPALIQRFRLERQILANLDHPNIARLIDGGSAPGGAPYVVVEYIDGVPIDRFCRERQIGTRQIVVLMQKVANAVDYAHRSLVVHRDIKPGNILVTGAGEPKLVDFGIAKLLEPEPDSRGLTRGGERLLTPEYASPEQLLGRPVTTASDVYSLGVVFCELLTGRVPQPFFQRTDSPLSPPGTPRTRITGDLAFIVERALAPDLEGRYRSAGDFARDLSNYLEGRPVLARKAGIGYRMSKFVRRNRLASAALAFAVLVLAVSAFALARSAADAAREARTATATADFLVSIFEDANPSESKGRTVTAIDVLDRGAQRLDKELADRPEVRARLASAIGRIYNELGRNEASRQQLLKAAQLQTELGDREALNLSDTLVSLAAQERLSSMLDESISHSRQALEVLKGHAPENALARAEALNQLGLALFSKRDYDSANRVLRDALQLYEKAAPSDDPSMLAVRGNLGMVSIRLGKYAEAESVYRANLASALKTRGENSPSTASALNNMSFALAGLGRFAERKAASKRVLEIRRVTYGESHPETSNAWGVLALALKQCGETNEAIEAGRKSVALAKTAFEPDDLERANKNLILAHVLLDRNLVAEAEASQQEATAILKKRFPNDPSKLADAWHAEARILAAKDVWPEAGRTFEQAVAAYQKAPFVRRDLVGRVLFDYGDALMAAGRFEEALVQFRGSHSEWKAAFGDIHPSTLWAESRIGHLLARSGRLAEGVPLLRNAIARLTDPCASAHRDTDFARAALGAWDPVSAPAARSALDRLLASPERVRGHPQSMQARGPRTPFAGRVLAAGEQNPLSREVQWLRRKIGAPSPAKPSPNASPAPASPATP